MNRDNWKRLGFVFTFLMAPFVVGADACSSRGAGRGAGLGELCGGLDADPCRVGLYCDFAADVGAADAAGAGRCADVPDPTVCPTVWSPVCGLDGRTYGNDCLAAAAGATVVADGACVPDVTGCIALYDPVCGSDGRTYGNACEAGVAGVTVVSTGECAGGACPDPAPLAPNVICPDGTIGGPVCDCDVTGCHWSIRDCEPLTVCGGFAGASCPTGQFCDYAVGDLCGAADQTGVCRDLPQFCTFEYAPVCGCDGNTYGNACQAAGNAVSVASIGACGGSSTCSAADCGPAPLSPLPMECAPDASGRCVWQQTCLPPPCAAPPPGCRYEGYTTCTCGTLVCDEPSGATCGGFLGLTCQRGEFCDYAVGDLCGAADQQGTCTPIPGVCPGDYDPVCGCDGKTYSNACHAAANGISVFATGVCGGSGGTCDPSTDCGPTPTDGLPVECLPDASGACTWQPTCLPPPCAAPPPGCDYVGGTTCTCGTLVCDQCALVDCLPPDPRCEVVPDGTCCGSMTCATP